MEVREYALSVVGTFLAAVGYRAYSSHYSPFAADITGQNAGISSIFCTEPWQIYTSIEPEQSVIPNFASCFEVTANGLFGEIYSSPEDIPEQLTKDVGITTVDGWIFPGFWDGHGHIVQYGMMESGVKVYNQDIPTILSSILEFLEKNPTYGSREKWIEGIGWDQAYFGGQMPTAEDLSHPLLDNLYISLARVDVHCIWVSAAVLRLLPDPLPPPPQGGSIPSDGVFCDNAMDLIIPFIPPVTKTDIEGYIIKAVGELHKVGLVGVMDAATATREVAVYKDLAERGELALRVYGMLECPVRNSFCGGSDGAKNVKVIRESGMFILRAVKLFADGALGSWGAALIDPYDDKPTRGTMLINGTQLTKVTSQWYSDNWQVNIHAIGDQANRAALDAFETSMALHPTMNDDRRLRIEHAQIINPSDQPRLESLGIIPSIQPTHATSDMAYAGKRLGTARLKHSGYRMSSLFPSETQPGKQRPVFGSDFPVEPPAPLHGMYAAVTRCNPNLKTCDRDVLWDDEKVSRLQAVRGFGRNVGYGGWLEDYGVGKIVKGGWADWVVLDKNILDEAADLRKVIVKQTWVGGTKVWDL